MSEKFIVVVGDIMVDEYWNGNSTRISPEAPVPVVDDIRVSRVLGGAANVALNARSFSSNTTIYGSIGNDKEGTWVTRALAQSDIKWNLHSSQFNNTITKARVMSNGVQLCRMDKGEINSSNILLNQQPDVIVISDYNKGTLDNDVIAYLMDFSCPVIVDPKGNDWEKYKSAYCLTPNKKEFEEVYGEFSIDRALQTIIELDLQGILVTLGAEGMVWVDGDGQSIWLESDAQEVFDVTGAGDTVIATFASFLHEGIESAMRKANKAAGVVVGKRGTAVVKKEDVIENVVFTNGCFDIIHSGHIALLNESSKLGDRLIVGLNSDDSVERIKRKPINNMYERKAVLESIEGVDQVIIFDEDTPRGLIELLKPDVLVKGGDYTVETVVGHDIVDEVVIFPTLEGRSTTSVIERIKNGKN